MAARTSQEEQKRRRRKRLLKGLLLGGAAVGVPALANALISRSTRRLARPRWGAAKRYAWKLGEISFQELGHGPPLVLLHSFGPGHDGEEWRAAAERLAEAEFRVYVPDFLGWGRSEKPRVAYDDELYIQQLADFIEDVAGERVVAVASGLSAAYAVQLAVDLPERVRALALVVPSGVNIHGDEPDLRDALVHRMLQLPVLGTSALNLYTSQAAIGRYLGDLFADPGAVDPARVDRHYRASHQPGAHRSLAAYLSGYLNHRVDEALGRLEQPTWIGWGREAKTPPVETADLWLHLAPDARLEVFESAANLPHVERPDAFCDRLSEFLRELIT